MVNVRAYKIFNRLLVQFFDSGERDTLSCPECGSCQQLEASDPAFLGDCQELNCQRCDYPLGLLSSPMGLDTGLEYGISHML